MPFEKRVVEEKKQSSIISTIIGFIVFIFFFIFFIPFISFFMMLSAFVGIIVILIFFIVFFIFFKKIEKSIKEQLKTSSGNVEIVETEMNYKTKTSQPRISKLPGQSSSAFSIMIFVLMILFILGFAAWYFTNN